MAPEREIDERVNFRNFHKLFSPRFYGILAPHFQTRNTKEVSDKAHEACCNGRNGRHLYNSYTLGKLINVSATRR